MKTKNQFLKSMTIVSSILIVAALLLAGCNGTFSLQSTANEEGGVDITGGVQPETAAQPSGGTNMDQTTLILIIVGIAFFVLLLVVLVTRGGSSGGPQA